MTYQEGEQTRIRKQSSKQAVALAMEGRWKEAVAANRRLIESYPNDIDAYNRLGRAHMELGEYSLARGAYEKAVELDPYNTIARKNLQRLSLLGDSAASTEVTPEKVDPQTFIEEVGKAGVVNLQRLGSGLVLAKTVAGSRVNLKAAGSVLTAENNAGEYLGQVEQRHGLRLTRMMEGGNQYSAAIISSSENSVTIIIKEIFQDPSQAGKLSFPPRSPEVTRTFAGDRIDDRLIRRQLEDGESASGDSGYAIVGGDGDVLVEDDPDEDEDEE